MDWITRFGTALAAAPLALSLTPALAAQNPAPAPAMTARDLVTLPRLGAPVAAPDGSFALYAVTETDPISLDRKPSYFLLDLTTPGAEPRALAMPLRASGLTIASDGFVYFLSGEHPDKAQPRRTRVWRMAISGAGLAGDPQVVADIAEADIAGFKLAPNGKRIALWGAIPRDCATFGCKERANAHLPGPGSGRLYEGGTGFVRHWDTWSNPGAPSRVFAFDLVDGRVSGAGVAVDGGAAAGAITANTPTLPFGGTGDLAFTPDASALYFTARLSNAAEPRSTNLDIYVSELGGTAPTLVTQDNPASDSAPVISPDGRHLAWLAMARPGYEADRQVIKLRDLSTGETRTLTDAIDLSFGELAWSADGSYLLATAQQVLDTPAFRIDPKTGAITRLDLMAGNEAHIANLTPLADGRLLFTRDSIGQPAELYLSAGLAQAKPLTNIVTTRMGQMAPTVTTRFSFTGAGGDTVWGQITRLKNQQGKVPVLLNIHGGPQGTYNDAWSTRWNPRVFASQGYAVVSIDFHGSTGYGQAFTDAINQDWGGKPLEDLQKGLAHALTLDAQLDGSRACAMGASYGGYMVNWIAGQWPDRFRCLVNHNGLFDTRAFYYSTEELWFPRWDFGGSYAEAAATYEKWNPVSHVNKWQTPMLVVLGEKDFRVPYTQGLGAFTALQERGIPAQLLVFPDENHWVLGAKNSLQWHDTVFAWLKRWLTDDKQAAK
ncbi:MAG: S9 family peptidase [Porphyrobacter sp.]|nr:S9 family peptidase [Porphyrobacter sp.]